MMDLRPTFEAPDDDPYLWLEDIDGEPALDWVKVQNQRTFERFGGKSFQRDCEELTAILDRDDKLPNIRRIGGLVYNFWTDGSHERGLWRRNTLQGYRANDDSWEVLLDLDALAAAEDEDWDWGGFDSLPPAHDRAIISLSHGGSDAVVLREFDLVNKCFVKDGFELGEARSGVEWLDSDTLLLVSAFGGDKHVTRAGYAKTVRLWRRGTAVEEAPVLFSVDADHVSASFMRDWNSAEGRILFMDDISTFDTRYYLGNRDGVLQHIDLPETAEFAWHNDSIAINLREDWTINGTTYPTDTVLGLQLPDILAGTPRPTVLWSCGDRSALESFFFVRGHLLLAVLNELRPSFLLFQPDGLGNWPEVELVGMPEDGDVVIRCLDTFENESDGTLKITVQDPLTPPTILLTCVGDSTPPTVLRKSPSTFCADGLVVTRHEAIAADGERIPYIQIGPEGPVSGEAPVHLTGYGGFRSSMLPFYSKTMGLLWLQRGGTIVYACIRGGGEFGTRWHEAGRGRFKTVSHRDFAAVAADLVRRGVTKPELIAAQGASNGGLLIGNMYTRFSDHFGGLLCGIPLTDMRRYTKLHTGSTWIGEYGEDWEHLGLISPYHQVGIATGSEPPIFITTNRRDDRVHPGHARKFAKKLEALGHNVWFYESAEGGHGYGANNREYATSAAIGASFLRDAIGWISSGDDSQATD